MKDTEVRDAITANCDGAKAYRLIQERAGVLYYAPSPQDKPPLKLVSIWVVPPGSYGVAYVDAGERILREHRVNVVSSHSSYCP